MTDSVSSLTHCITLEILLSSLKLCFMLHLLNLMKQEEDIPSFLSCAKSLNTWGSNQAIDKCCRYIYIFNSCLKYICCFHQVKLNLIFIK